MDKQKQYEVLGFSLSIALHIFILIIFFVNFSLYIPAPNKKNVIEVELIERIIVPEQAKKGKRIVANYDFIGEGVLLESKPFVISEQDFDKDTNLPIEKIDFETIKQKLSEHLIFPILAQKNGWKGVVQVALTINNRGKLIDTKIIKSSNKIFDDAVLIASLQLENIILPKPTQTSTLLFDVEFL